MRIEGRAPDGAKGRPPQLVFFYVAVDAAHAEECRAGTDAYIRHAAANILQCIRRNFRRLTSSCFRYGEALGSLGGAAHLTGVARRRSAAFRSSHTARRSPQAKAGASAARGVGLLRPESTVAGVRQVRQQLEASAEQSQLLDGTVPEASQLVVVQFEATPPFQIEIVYAAAAATTARAARSTRR